MKTTAFRSAFRGIYGPVRNLGAGMLIVGLALSASAKDGSSSGSAAPAPSVKSPPAPSMRSKPGVKSKRWYQVGVASWYGSKFQGRETADGETYDMNQMTCAHRSLPLGTWLRVTNLRNHKSAFVRVNDRGPALQDRIVDLSYAAARVLGLGGLGRVRLEPVNSSDTSLERSMIAQLRMPVMILPPAR